MPNIFNSACSFHTVCIITKKHKDSKFTIGYLGCRVINELSFETDSGNFNWMDFLKQKSKIILILPVLMALFSAWTLRIFQQNQLLAILQVILAVLLFLMLFSRLPKIFNLFISLCLIINCLFFVVAHFDQDLTQISALEKNDLAIRQNYYPHRLGNFFHNDYTLGFYKLERNFFTNLDFNQFFFGGAPRYRPYALDFDKFPLIYLPFFIFGAYQLMKKAGEQKIAISAILLVLIIGGFGNPDYILGIYPLYPIILAISSFGVYKIYA